MSTHLSLAEIATFPGRIRALETRLQNPNLKPVQKAAFRAQLKDLKAKVEQARPAVAQATAHLSLAGQRIAASRTLNPIQAAPAAAFIPARAGNGLRNLGLFGAAALTAAAGYQYFAPIKAAAVTAASSLKGLFNVTTLANATASVRNATVVANATSLANATFANATTLANATLSAAGNVTANASSLFSGASEALLSGATLLADNYPLTGAETLTGLGMALTAGIVANKIYRAIHG